MIPNGPGGEEQLRRVHRRLLKQLVGEGKVPQTRIDDAVRRILRVKFKMGLFDRPWPNPACWPRWAAAEHRARGPCSACGKSLVLLKNEHQALPLSKTLKRLHVAGKAADNLGMQCGGWTIDWQGRLGSVIARRNDDPGGRSNGLFPHRPR